MLTKTDFQKIGELVDEKINKRFKNQKKELAGLMDKKIDRCFKKELSPIKQALKRIEGNLQALLRLNQHDHERLDNHETRLNRIEKHLKPPSISNQS